MNLLPDYYEKNETMKLLQNILSAETERLENGLSDVILECFFKTASKMLTRYERILGLDVDVTQLDLYRRERIVAKLSGSGTSTKEMLQSVAASYSNGEVEVIEDNPNYKFTIRFVGQLGIPGNMDSLKLTIEEIKPAHLAVEYEYIYNTWSDVRGSTWEQVELYNWEEIRTVKLND